MQRYWQYNTHNTSEPHGILCSFLCVQCNHLKEPSKMEKSEQWMHCICVYACVCVSNWKTLAWCAPAVTMAAEEKLRPCPHHTWWISRCCRSCIHMRVLSALFVYLNCTSNWREHFTNPAVYGPVSGDYYHQLFWNAENEKNVTIYHFYTKDGLGKQNWSLIVFWDLLLCFLNYHHTLQSQHNLQQHTVWNFQVTSLFTIDRRIDWHNETICQMSQKRERDCIE